MAYNPNFDCDVCKAKKGEGNRWILGLVLSIMTNKVATAWVGIRPWSDEVAKADGVKHVCSDQCSNVWLQKENELLGR